MEEIEHNELLDDLDTLQERIKKSKKQIFWIGGILFILFFSLGIFLGINNLISGSWFILLLIPIFQILMDLISIKSTILKCHIEQLKNIEEVLKGKELKFKIPKK